MAESTGDKTHAPTEQRREDFRKEGRYARARDAGAVAASLGALAAVIGTKDAAATALRTLAVTCFSSSPMDASSGYAFRTAALALATLAAPIALGAALGGTAAGFAQAGMRFDTALIGLKIERLNPLPRIQRLLTPKDAMVETVGAILRVAVVGYAVYGSLMSDLPAMVEAARLPLLASLPMIGSALVHMALRTAAVLGAIAVADYAQSRFFLEREMKMTFQELRTEMRSQDGDPKPKARIRQRARALAKKRAISDVKSADVVITNPTHVAVALRYASSDAAPIVVAKGHDDVALRIRAEARKHGIPILESRALARALDAQVPLGKPIPGAHFAAVARILAFVYKLQSRTQRR